MILPDQLLIDDREGRRAVLDPGGSLTVGLSGQLQVGVEDEFMHRLLLQFWDRSGVWVVTNRGTRVTARVIQHRAVAVTDTRLPPGACLPVPPGESRVVFRTAERLYRLELTVAQVLRPPPLPASDPGAVVTKGHFSPTQEQIELLTALVEPLVLDPGAEDAAVPTVRRRSSWGRTPRSRRSRSRPGRWRSRRTRRLGGAGYGVRRSRADNAC